MDVVKRYVVDGIHFDDYFYPYKEKNFAGLEMDFPDDASWKKYGGSNGLGRDDWRRSNVDIFMQQVNHAIKGEKPWVKFGISPFGIWRPKNPPSISGFDAYAGLYADSRKWLREGWCDYFTPQLYWGIPPPQTSFTALLDWWNSLNVRHRHIWPGMDSLKVGEKWQPSEIVNQINITRHYPDAGHVHWSVMALMKNAALDAALTREIYRQPALIPASPWLNATSPPPPKLSVTVGGKSTRAQCWNQAGKPARGWVLQPRTNGLWTTQILPAIRMDSYLDQVTPDAVSVRAVDRVESLSEPALWTPKKYSAPEAPHGAARMK